MEAFFVLLLDLPSKVLGFGKKMVVLKRALDAKKECVEVDGLGQIVGSTATHGGHGACDISECRDDDDGQRVVARSDALKQRKPIHSGHFQVGDDDVGGDLIDEYKGALAVFGGPNSVALGGEKLLQTGACTGLVIDDKDAVSSGFGLTSHGRSRWS